MARAECAKWGLHPCRLPAGERCRYFEGAVLPYADAVTDHVKAKNYREAAEAYRKLHSLPAGMAVAGSRIAQAGRSGRGMGKGAGVTKTSREVLTETQGKRRAG
jgi:hypothetical protein